MSIANAERKARPVRFTAEFAGRPALQKRFRTEFGQEVSVSIVRPDE